MYVSPISTRLVRGRSMPAMRAIVFPYAPVPVPRAWCHVRRWRRAMLRRGFFPTENDALSVSSSASSAPGTRHTAPGTSSALPLLVLLVGTNDADDAAAPHDLALVANPFDRCPYLHTFSTILPRVTSVDNSRRTR